MPMIPVDTAVQLIVGPLIDDTDFKSLETGVAYNAAGMSVDLIKSSISGTPAKTDLTLTTGGSQDWVELGNGLYYIEITAAQNDTEGELQLCGVATGILPFISAKYQVVPQKVYNSLTAGSDNLEVDIFAISGDSLAASNLELMFDGTGYDASQSRIGSAESPQRDIIATLASQTSFTLSYASDDDDIYNGFLIIITNDTDPDQKAYATVLDYVGSTKTITLDADPGVFTMAVGDYVQIVPSLSSGGGGDATAANQTTIINHLTDVKGATWDSTNSLEAIHDDLAIVDGIVDDILVDTAEIGVAGAGLTEAGGTGDHLTAIDLPDQTMNITGNITGNLSGSVANVTGGINTAAGTITTLDGLDTAQDTQHGTTQTYLTNNLGSNGANATEAGGTGDHLTAIPAVDVGSLNGSSAAAARLALSAGVIIPGTVDSTAFTPTTTEFESDDITEATAQHYNDRVIIFTSGALIGQATSISNYSLETGRGHFTVVALTEAPGNNDTFIIV